MSFRKTSPLVLRRCPPEHLLSPRQHIGTELCTWDREVWGKGWQWQDDLPGGTRSLLKTANSKITPEHELAYIARSDILLFQAIIVHLNFQPWSPAEDGFDFRSLGAPTNTIEAGSPSFAMPTLATFDIFRSSWDKKVPCTAHYFRTMLLNRAGSLCRDPRITRGCESLYRANDWRKSAASRYQLFGRSSTDFNTWAPKIGALKDWRCDASCVNVQVEQACSTTLCAPLKCSSSISF